MDINEELSESVKELQEDIAEEAEEAAAEADEPQEEVLHLSPYHLHTVLEVLVGAFSLQ